MDTCWTDSSRDSYFQYHSSVDFVWLSSPLRHAQLVANLRPKGHVAVDDTIYVPTLFYQRPAL